MIEFSARAFEGETAAAVEGIAARSTQVDGQPPFNDQAIIEARAGDRRLVIGTVDDVVVSAAIVGDDEFELVVDPDRRGSGFGRATLETVPRSVWHAWAHGDHPAARALASSHHMRPVRTLLHLALDPLVVPAARPLADGYTIHTAIGFDPHEWVRLNARIFASHPEQGRITDADVGARIEEDWYDPEDFLLLRADSGELVGYCWLKLEPDSSIGEIYVIGVAPHHAGHGLGRALMVAGLERMRERGRTSADLYVEAENGGAVGLYRSLGFTDLTIDVQYARH